MSILKKFLPLLNRTSRCHWYHRVELRGVIDTAEFVIDTLEFYMTPQSQLSFIARNYQHQFLKSLKPKAEAKDEPYSKILKHVIQVSLWPHKLSRKFLQFYQSCVNLPAMFTVLSLSELLYQIN